MKTSLVLSLSLLSILDASYASPLKPRDVFTLGNSNKLVGSSFGFPGDQAFDYVIVGGGAAGMYQCKASKDRVFMR